MLPVVVASAPSAARGTPVNRGFPANSWFFPFRFRRGVRKGRGHAQSSVKMSILSLLFGRIVPKTVGCKKNLENLLS
jgi:hypothetical protein